MTRKEEQRNKNRGGKEKINNKLTSKLGEDIYNKNEKKNKKLTI